jgi:glycerol kinase
VKQKYVIALDQGTTSCRAIIFDETGQDGCSGGKGVQADLSPTRMD